VPRATPTYIDTHAHLNHPRFKRDRPAVLRRAADAGVGAIVIVGYDPPSSREAFDLAEQHEHLWATVGLHPHDAKDAGEAALTSLRNMAAHPKAIAVGETGLDYYRNLSPPDQQQQAFRRLIRLARDLGLPLIIHNREADEDTLRLLQEERADEIGGVFHCFSGDVDFARRVLDFGFLLGIDGPITYPPQRGTKSELARVVEQVPLEALLIETDCPWLAPQPHRGKRNEPAYVVEVAREIGRLRGVPVERVGEVTSAAARRLFPRLKPPGEKRG